MVDGAFAAEFVLCVGGGHLRASQILCIQLVGHGISTPIIVVFVVIITVFTRYNHSAIISCDNITVRISRMILPHYWYTAQPYCSHRNTESLVSLDLEHSVAVGLLSGFNNIQWTVE